MIPRFRAWDSVKKKFVEHFFITDNGLICNMEKPTSGYNSPIPVEKSELILMQSTNLHDKNSQEIFEGDIVKRDGIKRPEVVRFGEWIDVDSLGYKEQYIGFYFESEHEGQEWLHSVEPQFNHLYKILGNIYENKELLDA